MNSCEYLEKLGYDVTYLEVDGDGLISPEQVMDAIRPDTTLISVMFANNEVGTIEPIYQIGKIAREKQILFHTDAVQAYAQIPLSVNYYPVDLLSASAHKFHGPKGVGFLYIRDGIDIPSFIHGGSQERGKRAGTENVAGIVGMAKAAEIACGNMRKRVQKEIMLRNYLIERVMHEIPDVKLNGHRSIRLPGNVNFSFKGLEGASLLILLDEDGICASGGSACNTGEERISYVIKALGVPEEYAPGTIRLTLCGDIRKRLLASKVNNRANRLQTSQTTEMAETANSRMLTSSRMPKSNRMQTNSRTPTSSSQEITVSRIPKVSRRVKTDKAESATIETTATDRTIARTASSAITTSAAMHQKTYVLAATEEEEVLHRRRLTRNHAQSQ